MLSTEDEKLDIATGGDDDRRKSVIEAISKLGLKMMTSKQMITRLPILLAQKKAGNNSQKRNNEIRQIYIGQRIYQKQYIII